MKIIAVCVVLLSTVPLFAGGTETVNAPCEKAITKAMVISAHRKWASMRPDPQAPVLNIKTHGNFGKAVLIGSVFSHEKVGELVFDDQGGTCSVTSNGHPADVVLSDLVKTYSEQGVATGSDNSRTTKARDKAAPEKRSVFLNEPQPAKQ